MPWRRISRPSGHRSHFCHCGAGERGLMLSSTLAIAFAALVIERLAGYPKFIHAPSAIRWNGSAP